MTFENLSAEDADYVQRQLSAYIKSFEALKSGNQIESFKIDNATTAWASWTKRQQRLWTFYDKTGIRKRAVKRYRKGLQKIYDSQFENGIEAVDKLNDYEDRHKKYWFSSDPKNEIIFNVSIKPIHPAEYIQVDLQVTGSGVQV